MKTSLASRRDAVVIALSPVLLWAAGTGLELARGDTEDAGAIWLLATWAFYIPVFITSGMAVLTLARIVAVRSALTGSVAGALATFVSFSMASVAYDLPMRAWPLSSIVGAVMGMCLFANRSTSSVG